MRSSAALDMRTNRHVALLRGINVGGKNLIKMADLRACFEEMGLTEVQTYIQSGNVVFSSRRATKAKLEHAIEAALSETFAYSARVVVVSAAELARVVAQAPAGFGTAPDRYRYDVLYIKRPMTAVEALPQLRIRPGVDEARAGEHALYFQRLISKLTQSHLAKIVQQPVYQHLTIRNWNTTTRLLAMASA